MLGNVNWCCISTTKEFNTASAVYYREQRFAAENTVVVVGIGQVLETWSNVWHQRVWNSI